jgi:hypothetical protein
MTSNNDLWQETTNNPDGKEERYDLGTNLYNNFSAPPEVNICHRWLEQFLDKLTLEYINMMKKLSKQDTREIPEWDRILATTQKALLEDPKWSLVQSDKTGQWVPIRFNNYINNVIIHLNWYCNKIDRSRLDTIYRDTNALVDDIEDLCSDREMEFFQSWIKTRKIPSIRLSIKDHEPVKANKSHPTRLIVSAYNFTQCLSKLASKSI